MTNLEGMRRNELTRKVHVSVVSAVRARRQLPVNCKGKLMECYREIGIRRKKGLETERLECNHKRK